jgi:hypothetical protein
MIRSHQPLEEFFGSETDSLLCNAYVRVIHSLLVSTQALTHYRLPRTIRIYFLVITGCLFSILVLCSPTVT